MSAGNETFTEERLIDCPGEFPRMDDRYETLPHRRGFLALTDVPHDPRPGAGSRWIAGVDLTGRAPLQIHYPGDDCSVAGPVFVPAAPDAPEGVGYVLVVVGRHQEMRNDLLILDGQHVDAPPVATVALPIRIRRGQELATRTA